MPPGVEVEVEPSSPGAYREPPKDGAFRIRWKDRVDLSDAAMMGVVGVMTTGGLLGTLLHPASLVLSAYGAFVGTFLASWHRSGELVLGPSHLSFRTGRLRARGRVERAGLDAVRVVQGEDPKGQQRSVFHVHVGHGGVWTSIARPRSVAVAHYLAASVRVALQLDGE